MIHHNPEVEEKLEQFGIPVMVERSSYESHPLGRTEWIKLYAVLLGKEDVAEKAFKEQTDKLDKVLTSDDKDKGKTVAFFYINSTGAVNVRKNGDYVSNMIELAGGKHRTCRGASGRAPDNPGRPQGRRPSGWAW